MTARGQTRTAPATAPAPAGGADRRRAYFQRTLVDAYDKVGSHDVRWDADARKVMNLAVERWVQPGSDPDLDWQIAYWSDKAIAAGCDDPAVLYYNWRANTILGESVSPGVLATLSDTVFDSGYAPYLKFFAALHLAEDLARQHGNDTPPAEEVDRLLQAAYDNLAATLPEADFPTDVLPAACADLTNVGAEFYGDRGRVISRLADVSTKALPDSAIPDLILGDAYWRYAMDGDRDARHRVAVGHLRAALKKDPHLAAASAAMAGLLVDIGFPAALRQVDGYYRRAIADNPTEASAYRYEMASLNTGEPGSAERVWAFGRVCLATRRWDARIPFLLFNAQADIIYRTPNPLLEAATTQADRKNAVDQVTAAFYRDHPDRWQDVKRLYAGALAHHPAAVLDRIQYTREALLANDPDVAVDQLRRIAAVTDPSFEGLTAQAGFHEAAADSLVARGLRSLAARDTHAALNDFRHAGDLVPPNNTASWYGQCGTWMAQVSAGNKAQADRDLRAFVNAQPKPNPQAWPLKIASALLGDLGEADFLALGESVGPAMHANWTCESRYFVGMKRVQAGDTRSAKAAFAAAVATGQTHLLVYTAAQAELARLSDPH